MMTAMTISKVAEKAGVGIETVRFYERKGLVDQPPKPPLWRLPGLSHRNGGTNPFYPPGSGTGFHSS